MAVSSAPAAKRYVGDGAQRVWPVGFAFMAPEDVRAVLTTGSTPAEQARNERVLVYGRDYTVTGDGPASGPHAGGEVHAAVPAGSVLTLCLNMPIDQPAALAHAGYLSPEALESELDRRALVDKQLAEKLDRAVLAPYGADATPDQWAAELFDARDDALDAARDAAQSAGQAAQSAQKAEHVLAETIVAGQSAVREIREETNVQKERLQAVADTAIITVGREADRAHDEAERAEREADRAASTATLAVGARNLEATWTLAEDIPAGGVLTLPDALVYFPGRHMLSLSFEGVACYPGLHYEEIPLARTVDCPVTQEKDACPAGKLETFPDLPSDKVRLRFAAAEGTVFHAWIVASNVARHVEEAEEKAEQARDDAQAHADRACECAELSCECADEAEKAKDTAVNAAQDAQDSADRADDAATDAEKAAQAALAAHCHMGIASVLEAGLFNKPLPHGFYTLNPHIVLPATCSLPLYPVEDGEHILSGVEGFYLFAPRDPACDPGNSGGDTPLPPGDGFLPCGRRAAAA